MSNFPPHEANSIMWMTVGWEKLRCENFLWEFYIHGFVHRNSLLIRSNKMQQYAGIYLLQNHSTYFGCPSHRSSVVHQIVITASGTRHSI
jgi:hypothetical protein